MGPNESLLDVLLEVQNLDRVPRTGFVLRGVPEPESISEHSWQVVFLVWTLGSRIPEVDTARAVEIALLHDLAELRVGDLPRTAARYFPDGAKDLAERAALREILAPLPEVTDARIAEYQDAETAEARLVKACDKLQLMLKVYVYERWGAGGLEEFWHNPANFPPTDFAPVREVFDELLHRRGVDLTL